MILTKSNYSGSSFFLKSLQQNTKFSGSSPGSSNPANPPTSAEQDLDNFMSSIEATRKALEAKKASVAALERKTADIRQGRNNLLRMNAKATNTDFTSLMGNNAFSSNQLLLAHQQALPSNHGSNIESDVFGVQGRPNIIRSNHSRATSIHSLDLEGEADPDFVTDLYAQYNMGTAKEKREKTLALRGKLAEPGSKQADFFPEEFENSKPSANLGLDAERLRMTAQIYRNPFTWIKQKKALREIDRYQKDLQDAGIETATAALMSKTGIRITNKHAPDLPKSYMNDLTEMALLKNPKAKPTEMAVKKGRLRRAISVPQFLPVSPSASPSPSEVGARRASPNREKALPAPPSPPPLPRKDSSSRYLSPPLRSPRSATSSDAPASEARSGSVDSKTGNRLSEMFIMQKAKPRP